MGDSELSAILVTEPVDKTSKSGNQLFCLTLKHQREKQIWIGSRTLLSITDPLTLRNCLFSTLLVSYRDSQIQQPSVVQCGDVIPLYSNVSNKSPVVLIQHSRNSVGSYSQDELCLPAYSASINAFANSDSATEFGDDSNSKPSPTSINTDGRSFAISRRRTAEWDIQVASSAQSNTLRVSVICIETDAAMMSWSATIFAPFWLSNLTDINIHYLPISTHVNPFAFLGSTVDDYAASFPLPPSHLSLSDSPTPSEHELYLAASVNTTDEVFNTASFTSLDLLRFSGFILNPETVQPCAVPHSSASLLDSDLKTSAPFDLFSALPANDGVSTDDDSRADTGEAVLVNRQVLLLPGTRSVVAVEENRLPTKYFNGLLVIIKPLVIFANFSPYRLLFRLGMKCEADSAEQVQSRHVVTRGAQVVCFHPPNTIENSLEVQLHCHPNIPQQSDESVLLLRNSSCAPSHTKALRWSDSFSVL
eukprot:Lankesteria_metandrocarpae@DN7104_c0_g1_i1.p1